ncbi:TPA: exodeoxyribonuclease V subunit alpha, partial [Stenotrophomonas maltophilia]|nr:exodeoxyribonuclease V subunit alpha [Stenotrophomonas maltophilia]
PQRLLEGVPEWPAAQDWLAQLRASPWVAIPEQADAIAEDAPLVLENGLLYLRRYREYERQLAAGLQRIGRHPLPAPDMAALAPLFAQLFPQASGSEDHQARAAGVTLRHPLALVTGGPGTGK